MTSPLFNISGPASGIDTAALIDAIIARMAIPKNQIESRVTARNARITALGEMRTKIAALRTASEALRNVTLFGGATAPPSSTLTANISPPGGGTAGFSASVVGAGTAGTYGVEVTALAQAPRLRSQTYVDPNAALGYTGNLVINGVATTLVAGDSLATLAGKLNTSLAGVATAAVENVGPGQFQLVVTGNTAGVGNTFTVTSTGAGSGPRLGFQTTVYTQARVVESNHVYRNGAGALATATTLLTDLRTNGNVPLNYVVGDTITVQVVDKDGNLQSNSLVVAAGTRVQEILSLMAGEVPGTTNSVVGGRLRLTSTTLGPNAMAITSLFVEKSPDPNGRIAVAGTAISNTAPAVLDQVGQDAAVRINGTTFYASSNTGLTFAALPDLTLNLSGVSTGGSSTLTVSSSAVAATDSGLVASRDAVKALVTAYNELRAFLKEQGTPTGENIAARPPLYNDPALRSVQSLLSTPFLASLPLADPTYNRPSTIGIQVSRDGTIVFDEGKFNAAYNDDPAAVAALIRQTSAVTGANLSVVALGTASQPGTYAVAVSALATRPTMAGAGFGGVYMGGGPPDTFTIIDRRTGSQVQVLITSGMTTAQIAAAISAAAATPVSEVRATSVAFEDAVAAPASDATTLADLRGPGGAALGIANGDKINFSGRRGDGSAYVGNFLITDVATQTLGDLRSAVQSAIGTSADVQIVNGKLQITTLSGGASTTLSIGSDNLGGGSLAFGSLDVLVTGRPALDITAADVGGQLEISSGVYGSASGIEVVFTDEGGTGPEQLGFTSGQVVFGTDIVGTIGGIVATGFGQQLSAAVGSAASGMIVRYDGATTGVVGSVGMNVGIAAGLQRITNDWLRSVTGLLDTRISRLDSENRGLQSRIELIDGRLARRRESLIRTFARMEEAMSKFQSTGNFLQNFIANANRRVNS